MPIRIVTIAMFFFLAGCGDRVARPQLSADATESPGGATAAAATVRSTTEPSVDWPWWRGPNRNGVANGPAPPVRWSATENVVWKVSVPGRGHGVPTVVGDRVYLPTADDDHQIQSVLAFDRKTGDVVWHKDVNKGGFPAQIHPHNSHATPTIAVVGDRIFAVFYHHDSIQVTALDHDGNQLWQESAGSYRPEKHRFGYAPSPSIYLGTVIISAEADTGSYLVALDGETGAERWRTPRPQNNTFSSPTVGQVAGQHLLLISGHDRITAYDPATGRSLWFCPATTRATCGTLVWDGDLVFGSGGYPKAETVCVRVQGDSGTVVWSNQTKCYEQSLVAHNGYLYAVNDGGIAYCWRTADGEEMWKERLPGGPVSASPVLAGNRIYMSNERGTTYVFSTNPDAFKLLGTNQLGDDAFSTPSISGGRIYLRVGKTEGDQRREYLYCIGEQDS